MTRTECDIEITGQEADSAAAPRDFVELYDAYLGPVWRFVRSRVPDHHEAQDVTSDAFSRAWRSWPRFNPAKGTAAAWLFGITRHAIADWWRRAPRNAAPQDPLDHERLVGEIAGDGLGAPDQRTPELALLEEDRLHEVGRALAVLNDHEREVLALRFGAELKAREIAEVLGVTPGSVTMTLHRAIGRVRTRSEVGTGPVAVRAGAGHEDEALVLDTVIEGILERGHPELSDDELDRLVLHLAVVHAPPVPDELGGRIASCVTCENAVPAGTDDDAPSVLAATRGPQRVRGLTGGIWIVLLGPACLVCVLPLWLAPPLAAAVAAGFGFVPEVGHYVALAASPLIAWLVWRNRGRHGHPWPARLAVAGAGTLAVHALLHVDGIGTVLFVVSDLLGWGLLSLAVVWDVLVSVRRRREERRWLERVVAGA